MLATCLIHPLACG